MKVLQVVICLVLALAGLCSAAGITIIEASFGKNCNGALLNNQKTNLGTACNGTQTCSYTISTAVIGDPAYGCLKEYAVRYSCPHGIVKSFTVFREADNKTFFLGCISDKSGISVVEASYGKNCNASLFNNQKANLGTACDRKETCSYTVNTGVIGDPAVGCGKTYVVQYSCPNGILKSFTVGAEADSKTFSMDCTSGAGISVLEASYGKNCNASLFNNQKANLGKACNGKQSCAYLVNTTLIGDPAFGCGKTYFVRYSCANGMVQTLTVKAEADGTPFNIQCASTCHTIGRVASANQTFTSVSPMYGRAGCLLDRFYTQGVAGRTMSFTFAPGPYTAVNATTCSWRGSGKLWLCSLSVRRASGWAIASWGTSSPRNVTVVGSASGCGGYVQQEHTSYAPPGKHLSGVKVYSDDYVSGASFCFATSPTMSPAKVPTKKPVCFCIKIYKPVCGVDGATYSNACVAGCAGVKVAYTGPCSSGEEGGEEEAGEGY